MSEPMISRVRKLKIELYGEDGADKYDAALTAAHAFAQASGCPPGYNVFFWLDDCTTRQDPRGVGE